MLFSLAALRARHKTWSASVVINAVAYTIVNQLPSRSMGSDRVRSTCSFVVREYPECAAGDVATVLLTMNGETVPFFVGQVDSRPMQDDSGVWTVNLVDAQHLLTKTKTYKTSWRNVPFTTAITKLLDLAGIPAELRGTIFDPGATFMLGPNYAIKFKGEYVVLDLLNELLDWAGCSILVGTLGKINIIAAKVFPIDAEAVYSYCHAADMSTATELGFTSASRTIGGFEGATRSFKASGPRRPDRQIPDATFTVFGMVGGKDEEKAYQLIQTNECAEAIAEREIVRLNRISTEVQVDGPLNANLRPGDTVMFRDPLLEYSELIGAIVLTTSTSSDAGMTMLLSVGPEPPPGDITLIPPPGPNFSYTFDRQLIGLVGAPAVRTLVQCHDSSSDPSGFAITKLSWTATCAGSVTPLAVEWSAAADTDVDLTPTQRAQQLAGKNPVFVFSTLDGASITLIAESTSGEGGSTTKSINPPESEVVTRVLAVAAPEGWRILADAAGWRMYNPGSACTAVPNINVASPPLGGFSNGNIYETLDLLFTPPRLVATLTGQVNGLFVNLTDPSIVLAAHGNSVSRSTDSGESWSILNDFGQQVNYVEDDQVNPLLILACSGNKLYKSADGATFFVGLTGPVGAVARKVSVAPGGVAIAFANTDLEHAIMLEGGGSVDWSQVPEAQRPITGCSSVCLLPDMSLIATAGVIHDAVGDPSYPAISYLATGAPGGLVYRLAPGGPGFVATLLYTTLDPGPLKSLNLSGAYPIDTATAAYRIGYCGVSNKPPPPQLIVLPSAQSGARDYLWHYLIDTGWSPKALPLPAQAWSGVITNPTSPMQWIIWAGERAFWTANAALSWTEIKLPHSGGSILDGSYAIRAFAFTGVGANWIVQMWANSAFGAGRSCQSYIASGNGPTNLRQLVYGSGMNGNPPVAPTTASGFIFCNVLRTGMAGQVYGYGSDVAPVSSAFNLNLQPIAPNRQIWMSATLNPTVVGATEFMPWDTLLATSRELLATDMTNIGYAENYANNMPSPFIAGGQSVVCLAAGIFVGNRQGIGQILDFRTTPMLQVVAGGDNAVGTIVRGRRRLACACRGAGPTNQHVIYGFNGESWTSITVPDVFIGAENVVGGLADVLGVVEP